jgi:molybdate/tungstate transport system substrate-binding protein
MYPWINVGPPLFEGSGAVAQEENLTKQFSLEASADTVTMPNVLFPKIASYEIAFGITSMTIIVNLNSAPGKEAYTVWQQGQSYAPLSAQFIQTWKQIFGIIAFNSSALVGVSDPFTDPSGYQAVCMTKLAGLFLFGDPSKIYDPIYTNSSKSVMRSTETNLLPLMASQSLSFIISAYKSNAIPQVKQYANTAYITLPPQINLGNMSYLSYYQGISFSLTEQGVTKQFSCNPVIYTMTIPKPSPNPQAAALFAESIFSPSVQQILISYGITPLTPGLVYGDYTAVPDTVKPFVMPVSGVFVSIFPNE